jgi:hypothetical protein
MQIPWRYKSRLKRAMQLPWHVMASRCAKKGWGMLRGGHPREARGAAVEGLNWYRDSNGCYDLLSGTIMPEWTYLRFLEEVHALLKPVSYFEIGVSTGLSLRLVRERTRAVGVDPEPRVPWTLPPGVSISAMTSDAFFETRNFASELGSPTADMVFIDGLHTFEQTLLDFIHVERFCRPGTLLFLHDCLPVTRAAAAKERQSSFWCGDVWKMVPCLEKYRPDLKISTVAAHPSGLVVITSLNAGSDVLAKSYRQILSEFEGLELSYDVIDFDTDALKKSLPASHDTAVALVESARNCEGTIAN